MPRVGVIDWTFSRPIGLPLHDLVFFLGTYCLQVRKGHGVASLERMFAYTFLERNGYSRLANECLARYCRALDIDRSLVSVLFALCLEAIELFAKFFFGHLGCSQLLPQSVMNFSRDAAAFFILHGHQTA